MVGGVRSEERHKGWPSDGGIEKGCAMKALRRTLVRIVGSVTLILAAGAPFAAWGVEGHGYVEAKRGGAQPSVVLNGETYRVTERTTFEGPEGQRLTLSDVPALAEGASAEEAGAWFDWQGDSRDRVLNELKLRDID